MTKKKWGVLADIVVTVVGFALLTSSQKPSLVISQSSPATMLPPTQIPDSPPVSTAASLPVFTTFLNEAIPSLAPVMAVATPLEITPPPAEPIPNQIIITFNPSATAAEKEAYLAQISGTVVQNLNALNSIAVSVPAEVAALPLPQSNIVAISEPDYFLVALADETSDPLYPQQWSLPIIGAPDAWNILSGSEPIVTVAVIDSGVCANHPDLTGRLLPGYDFVEGDSTPQDDFGHGCGVTGVIAANANNAEGIAGIAPNVQILPLRVLDARGVGTYSDVAAAIVYAADNGANIINLSLGGTAASTFLQNSIDYANSRGVMVIAAAGNTGGAVLYPAAYAPVIAVASVDANLHLSSFSSFGPEIDLYAPGRDILTTSRDGQYQTMTGTSFAAPEAAGIAALELARGNHLTANGGMLYFSPDIQQPLPVTPAPTVESAPQARSKAAPLMRNPAAVYCTDLGYQYEIVPGIADGETGMCILPDGQRCEQWDFYAGKCGQQYSYCVQQGLGIVTLNDGKDPFSPEYAACTNTSGEVTGTVNELSSLSSRAEGCYNGNCPESPAPAESLGNPINPVDDSVSSLSVPASLDWRNYMDSNWLTGVRNQGSCGSCWAFAAVGVTESALKIGAGNPNWNPDLSEQYLISPCGANAGSCALGGWAEDALLFIRDHGVVNEACMPYEGVDSGQCSPACSALTQVNEINYTYGPDVQYIKQNLVARGPVAVYLGIGSSSGTYWDGDILRCMHDIPSDGSAAYDHAVVLVGYDDAGGYWIGKNSWGTYWNGNGYFKIGYNECNIDNTFMAYAQQPVPAPVSLMPDNGNMITSTSVTFSWQASGTPLQSGYNFRITTDVNPETGTRLVDTTLTKNSYTYLFPSGGVYYWHVRTISNSGDEVWATHSVVVSDLLTSAPVRNVYSSSTVQLTWGAVTWASGYEIQLDDNSAFSSPETLSPDADGLSRTIRDIGNGQYYWRVRVIKADNTRGSWSAVESFVVNNTTS